MKVREFLKRLRKAGVAVVKGRGRGSHYLVFFDGKQTTAPHHSGDMGTYFCKTICKQLGLDPKEVL